MAKLSKAGEKVLASRNFVMHTRVYVNDVLQIDTSMGYVLAPVVNYQVNRSRKLGAAKLALTVSNVEGKYSYHRSPDPVFSYGNRIRVQEGLAVGSGIEWFTRFTGIIVAQVASNVGGKPSLQVSALDHMKMLLDYLPDELVYRPTMVKVTKEQLVPVGESFQHYRGNPDNLPWADIPYPLFYKDGTKVKENYDIDLINGEVFFGEQMWAPTWREAGRTTGNVFAAPMTIPDKPIVRRSFKLVRYGSNGIVAEQAFEYAELPVDVAFTKSGRTLTFSNDPFHDLTTGQDWNYVDRKIMVSVSSTNSVTVDYWYYDNDTNLAEDVIKDLAIRAGFKESQIDLAPTGVSLKTLRFTNLTIKNGFEILQKVKQQLSPNYIITCDCDGKLRGYYAAQMSTADYELELIKRIDAPISEDSLYTAVVAHGITLNPNDLTEGAVAENLLCPPSVTSNSVEVPYSGGSLFIDGAGNAVGSWFLNKKKKATGPTNEIIFGGNAAATLNKKVDDQMSWQWRQKNNDVPPKFPIDILKVTLAEPKKIEEISLLVGDYNGGTIEQTLSFQVSENGEDWFYIDRASRGVHGASSQWVTVKGGELQDREVQYLKIRVEAGFNWVETHTTSKSGGWFFNPKTSVKTDNYYNWIAAIKEIQIWENNTIEATSVLANYLGTGNGENPYFYFPNTPIVPGTERLYVEGVQVPLAGYTVDTETGEVKFYIPPHGVVTSDYAVPAKIQALSQQSSAPKYGGINVISPPGTVVFTGGDIQPGSPQYRILKKIGMKKIALPADNYLNSYASVKTRGEEMLQEITRMEETLSVDAVYRPDVDICQTLYIFDPLLGISDLYFIEEITEGKQGYKPTLNIRVSKYSL